jgi:L-glutamine-phosphate cytidylyltransferase
MNNSATSKNLVILAAGQGSRLSPLTINKPKALVRFQGKPIIESILEYAEHFPEIKNIIIVTGHKQQAIASYIKTLPPKGVNITLVHNKEFSCTNMVYSFFKSSEFWTKGADLIISYSDIIYDLPTFKKLISQDTKNAISIVADKEWLPLWKQRFADPLSDAESFATSPHTGDITSIGQRIESNSIKNIEAQFIGLFRFDSIVIDKLKAFYHHIDSINDEGTSAQTIDFTCFFQKIIHNHISPISPVYIKNRFIEIDSTSDLSLYNKLYKQNLISWYQP